MAVSAKSLGLDELPVEDKLDLINDLWEGIVASEEVVPISDELAVELDRRLAAYRADPSRVVSPEQLRARIRAEIGE